MKKTNPPTENNTKNLVCNKSHFNYNERLIVEAYLRNHQNQIIRDAIKTLAISLCKHPKTIAREIQRGLVQQEVSYSAEKVYKYFADVAERRSKEKAQLKGRPLKIGNDIGLSDKIENLIIEEHYSPYAVVAYLNKNGWDSTIRLSEKTIYNYIQNGLFYKLNIEHLPRKGKHRRRKERVPRQHKRLDNALHSIELRPSIVNGRLEFGHWEGDTIVGGVKKSKYCLLTLTERSTRQEIVRKIPCKEASSVCVEFNKIERELGTDNFVKIFKTITFDNGCEFSDINGIETSCITPTRKRTMVYFAHPYVASDRGSNENGNGIIRRFISKGSDIAKYTKKVIRQIQEWINTYPRKIFSGKSSIEELISRNVLPFSCLSALLKI